MRLVIADQLTAFFIAHLIGGLSLSYSTHQFVSKIDYTSLNGLVWFIIE